jgi:hypothetical protein
VEAGAPSTDDEELFSVDCCETILDLSLGYFSFVELGVGDFSDFREIAVEVIDLNFCQVRDFVLQHIQI